MTIDGTTQPGYSNANVITIDAQQGMYYPINATATLVIRAVTIANAKSGGLFLAAAPDSVIDRVVVDYSVTTDLTGRGFSTTGCDRLQLINSSARYRAMGA